jgi:NADP-dependent aldehyde dehydrogenase
MSATDHEWSGGSLIKGAWMHGDSTFTATDPSSGASLAGLFYSAGAKTIAEAGDAAREALPGYRALPLRQRADFLRSIANRIDQAADQIVGRAQQETALPEPRLRGETARTTGQLRLFANWIEEGSWLDARIDRADPNRKPAAKPDLRLANEPVGPVAVFGASNFPLAFSVAGGDSASALSAGCPVIVRAHPLHPGTSELTAMCLLEAIKECGVPSGVFGMLQGNEYRVGQGLVLHPGVKAVAFTGSYRGGKALFDLAASRPEPIPFYAEMGSINPVFVLSGALTEEADAIARGWVESLTLGVGQFCTNPGILVTQRGPALERFLQAAGERIQGIPRGTMLSATILGAWQEGTQRLRRTKAASEPLTPSAEKERESRATFFLVSAESFLKDRELQEEIFGPTGIVVVCNDADELIGVAASLRGQLTATVHATAGDEALAHQLLPLLRQRAGRILFSGFPTGVEVSHAMQHGGPFPATTDSRSTSVGTLAMRRFLRPVSYQNVSDQFLPEALQNANPLGILRLVDGVWTRDVL